MKKIHLVMQIYSHARTINGRQANYREGYSWLLIQSVWMSVDVL